MNNNNNIVVVISINSKVVNVLIWYNWLKRRIYTLKNVFNSIFAIENTEKILNYDAWVSFWTNTKYQQQINICG